MGRGARPGRRRNDTRKMDKEADMATPNRPNILVIWGDDIGIWNLSCYSQGTMGYRTPNIDRIAAEDWKR